MLRDVVRGGCAVSRVPLGSRLENSTVIRRMSVRETSVSRHNWEIYMCTLVFRDAPMMPRDASLSEQLYA